MNPNNHEGIEKLTETGRRYEAMRHEVMEMHLFDEDADEEKALCGADTSHDLRSLQCYLEERVHGLRVRSICQECKVLAVPLAEEVIEAAIEKHEAEDRLDVAEDYHDLVKTLARETGQDSLAD